jgi:hypothetical protein
MPQDEITRLILHYNGLIHTLHFPLGSLIHHPPYTTHRFHKFTLGSHLLPPHTLPLPRALPLLLATPTAVTTSSAPWRTNSPTTSTTPSPFANTTLSLTPSTSHPSLPSPPAHSSLNATIAAPMSDNEDQLAYISPRSSPSKSRASSPTSNAMPLDDPPIAPLSPRSALNILTRLPNLDPQARTILARLA